MSFEKSRDPAYRVCLASRITFERDQTPDSGVASQCGGSLYISVKLAGPSHILGKGGVIAGNNHHQDKGQECFPAEDYHTRATAPTHTAPEHDVKSICAILLRTKVRTYIACNLAMYSTLQYSLLRTHTASYPVKHGKLHGLNECGLPPQLTGRLGGFWRKYWTHSV